MWLDFFKRKTVEDNYSRALKTVSGISDGDLRIILELARANPTLYVLDSNGKFRYNRTCFSLLRNRGVFSDVYLKLFNKEPQQDDSTKPNRHNEPASSWSQDCSIGADSKLYLYMDDTETTKPVCISTSYDSHYSSTGYDSCSSSSDSGSSNWD